VDEQEIIRKAKENDHTSFEKLVIQYKSLVEKLAFQFGIRPEQIPDIVQETFIKVYQNLDQFHKGKFSTWLYQITLNTARDSHRKNKRNDKIVHKAKKNYENPTSVNLYFESDVHLLLHEAIQVLDVKYRMPLILFYFHDQTYDEIAMILKLKSSAVKTRMHRGRTKLKTLYEKLEKEEADSNGRQTIG